MFKRAFLILLLLSACGRPLTENEIAFSRSIHGDMLDVAKVRLIDGAPTKGVTFRRKARPRTTCREKILPPVTTEYVTAKPAAVALWNTVLFDEDWYLEDYLSAYPGEINLVAAMLISHELTHVWQWQNRKITRYSPLKAAREHQVSEDPYLFDVSADRNFLEFGYEQQGSIVEEYVCCRALDPLGSRTERLHGLIGAVMPLTPLPEEREFAVRLPWDGVELKGICS